MARVICSNFVRSICVEAFPGVVVRQRTFVFVALVFLVA